MTRDLFDLWRYRGPQDPKAKAKGTLGNCTRRVHRVGTGACSETYTRKMHLEGTPRECTGWTPRGQYTRANVPGLEDASRQKVHLEIHLGLKLGKVLQDGTLSGGCNAEALR